MADHKKKEKRQVKEAVKPKGGQKDELSEKDLSKMSGGTLRPSIKVNGV